MSVFQDKEAFKNLIDKMVKDHKINAVIDELGKEYYFVSNDGILFCPNCKYPMEISDQFNCKNCNKEYKLVK